MRILICASEITPYFKNSYGALVAHGHELLVMHQDSNFTKRESAHFADSEELQFLNISELRIVNISRACRNFLPELVIVPALFRFKFVGITLLTSGKKVLISDTFWHGTVKQRFLLAVGKNVIRRIFDFAFVPGSIQVDFMLRLGFKKEMIFQGLYAVPLGKVTPDSIVGEDKSLLFIGRLVHEKNVSNMVDGYMEYRKLVQNPYNLKIAGSGPLLGNLTNLPGVILLGYVDNDDLPSLIQDSVVLLLMSEFEPWGVVVSEAIANARPVICSIACGSSADLVVNEMNGYVLESTSTSEISSALVKFHELKPAQLISMANHSISIATDFGKNDWVSTMQGIERCIS